MMKLTMYDELVPGTFLRTAKGNVYFMREGATWAGLRISVSAHPKRTIPRSLFIHLAADPDALCMRGKLKTSVRV